MGSTISAPVAIAIACIGGVAAICAGVVLVLVLIRRRKDDAQFAEVDENCNASIDLGTGTTLRSSSLDVGKQRLTFGPARQLFRAFSDRSHGRRQNRIATSSTPKARNVLQRKRHGGHGGRATSLPVFSMIESRIPSPTSLMAQRSQSIDHGEAFALSPLPEGSHGALFSESRATLRDCWSPGLAASEVSQPDLRPQPLFHSHSHSLSGQHLIPSAHLPAGIGGLSMESGPSATMQPVEPSLPRCLLGPQQIGDAPSRAPPAPPQDSAPFKRVRSTHDPTHSNSPRARRGRSRSMESLLSGTSSILLSSGSPEIRRKRSMNNIRRSLIGYDIREAAETPASAYDEPSEPSTRPPCSGPALTVPPTRPELLGKASFHGNVNDPWLARSKSSALSMALLEASFPGSQPVTPEKANGTAWHAAHNKRHPLDPPVVLTPSPQRLASVDILNDYADNASADYESKSGPLTARSQSERQYRDATTRLHSGGSQYKKLAVPGPPRSPRLRDRPQVSQSLRVSRRRSPTRARSPLRAGRCDPVHRVRRAETGSTTKPAPSLPSNSSLESTPPRLVRRTGTTLFEGVGCGALASQLRRIDSFYDEEHGSYFNLSVAGADSNGQNSMPPQANKAPPKEISVNRGASTASAPVPAPVPAPPPPSAPAPGSSAPPFQLPPLTSSFQPPASLQYIFPHSRTPSPALAPAFSPTPPGDDPYVDNGAGWGRRGLGIGLGGRFNIGPAGLTFSPASSLTPSPCPSPPHRSPLRQTLTHPPADPLHSSTQSVHGNGGPPLTSAPMSRSATKATTLTAAAASAARIGPSRTTPSRPPGGGTLRTTRSSVVQPRSTRPASPPRSSSSSGRGSSGRGSSGRGSGGRGRVTITAAARRAAWPQEGRYRQERGRTKAHSDETGAWRDPRLRAVPSFERY